MTEKRFERIYEDVDVFCRDNNARTCQLIGREDYDKIVDLLNEQHKENKQLLQSTQNFLHAKLTDCETLFEQANANSDIIYLKGMVEIGGIQTQLIANIGKRQAYQEVLEFLRKTNWEI